ncbi:hypothetical protein EVAR_50717_1 [Eumeta japonica]|uniref:Uncharacterized protein n=1 Tax=Eumeta variegata TaxID=151549 RepID=A0A4C1YM43_EUMVA|nr:hypothetical protein EVAR_50717_1 [Eumeta japonica]
MPSARAPAAATTEHKGPAFREGRRDNFQGMSILLLCCPLEDDTMKCTVCTHHTYAPVNALQTGEGTAEVEKTSRATDTNTTEIQGAASRIGAGSRAAPEPIRLTERCSRIITPQSSHNTTTALANYPPENIALPRVEQIPNLNLIIGVCRYLSFAMTQRREPDAPRANIVIATKFNEASITTTYINAPLTSGEDSGACDVGTGRFASRDSMRFCSLTIRRPS